MMNSITRREWFRQSAGLAAVGCAAKWALPRSASATEFPRGRYVDVHTHLGTVWNNGRELTATELLRWMDASDIAQAVVLPLVSPEASSYPLSTEFVLAETRPHRDRLIPFCAVDPRTSYSGGHAGLVAMLRRYVDAGARGFGEHKPGVAIDDPRNRAIYAACSELKLPVVVPSRHTTQSRRTGLAGVGKCRARFSRCSLHRTRSRLVGVHRRRNLRVDLGNYPRGDVAPGGAIDRLMQQYPNLYGDLSAGSGAGAIRRDLKFGREFLIRRQDRLMFGTDFLAPGQEVPQLELFAQLELPADVAAKIFRDNARRLLGLTG